MEGATAQGIRGGAPGASRTGHQALQTCGLAWGSLV